MVQYNPINLSMVSTKLILFVVILLTIAAADECNATLAHYLSPHSLGRQDEIADAMKILCKQIRPTITTYQSGRSNYTLYNFSIQCIYNDGRQTADILSNNTLLIKGGTIEFLVNLNYSIARTGSTVFGGAFASVISDTTNFSKSIGRDGAQTVWMLTPGTNASVEINSPLKLKRIQPKQTDDDVTAITEALTSATSQINPANIRQQIVILLNSNYSSVLNQTLREEVFNNKVNYTFHHPFIGELAVNYTNFLYKFTITQEEGFELQFMNFIDGGSTKFCRYDLPADHKSYSLYGGIQSAISFDLVRETARYIAKKGWINTAFENGWESNAFQMFVGDLYQTIPESQKIPPKTRLTGSCNVQNEDTIDVRRRGIEEILVNSSYTCQLRTNDTSKIVLSEFEVSVEFFIRLVLEQQELIFTISGISAAPTFKPSGAYIVQDVDLAKFQLSMALKTLIGYRVFGTGYKTWPRDVPELQVDTSEQYIFLYDQSQIPHGLSK